MYVCSFVVVVGIVVVWFVVWVMQGCFMVGMWFALLLGVVGYWCCAIKLLIVLLFFFSFM